MDLPRFLNALKILRSIDRDELQSAGVDVHDDRRWVEFREWPITFLLRASDADQERVWAIIEARQPKEKDRG